jgi:hypothetical protein
VVQACGAARRRHNANQPLEEPGGSYEGSNNEAEESGEDGVPLDQAKRIFKIMMETWKLSTVMGIHTAVFTTHMGIFRTSREVHVIQDVGEI